jgi:hypothetical protein
MYRYFIVYVLVSILLFYTTFTVFFLWYIYRCKYSVYEVHSKSFQNQFNLFPLQFYYKI